MNIINFLTYEKDTGKIIQTGSTNDTCLKFYENINVGVIPMIGDSNIQYIDLSSKQLTNYTDDELLSKSNIPINHIWKLPDRTIFDTRDINEVKAQRWEYIKIKRSLAELSPFIYDGKIYDSNKESISGAVQMALLSKLNQQPFSINWTLADNSVINLNSQEMINIGVALGNHIIHVYDIGRNLRNKINSTLTSDEVNLIVWDSI